MQEIALKKNNNKKKKLFYCEDSQKTEQVALKGCGVSITEDF